MAPTVALTRVSFCILYPSHTADTSRHMQRSCAHFISFHLTQRLCSSQLCRMAFVNKSVPHLLAHTNINTRAGKWGS